MAWRMRSLLWLTLVSSALAIEETAADVAEIASRAGVSIASVQSEDATSCGVGTYYWGAWKGRHYCVKCPSGFTSDGCSNCSPDPTRTTCYQPQNCQRGNFFDSNTKACTTCPVGKWQSAAGKSLCYDCPTGMFQPTAGLYSCYWCPVGQYGATTGLTRCSKCDSCPKGEFGSTAAMGKKLASDCSCDKCAKGKYAPAGYTTCFNCPTGRFQHKEGMYSCYYCPTGKFGGSTGQETCSKCPNGKTNTAKGQDSSTSCTVDAPPVCEVGKYRYMEAATSKYQCLNCPAGMYGKLVSEAYGGHCYACPAGQTQSETGQSSCNKMSASTIEFKVFDYKDAATLASDGWKLLSYQDMATYKDLFLEDYKRNSGIRLIEGFQSSSCCLTVSQGYRLTANSKSYVYPMSITGGFEYPSDDFKYNFGSGASSQLQCNNQYSGTFVNGKNVYTAGNTYRLAYHDGTRFVDLSEATSLFAAQGSGLCVTKADEANPGIFMLKVAGGDAESANAFCKEINNENLCLSPQIIPSVSPTKMPTLAPTHEPTTLAPTMQPTPVPTEEPTPVPTNEPTKKPTYAPTAVPTEMPIPCTISVMNWNKCSRKCDSGVQWRYHLVTQFARNGGTCITTTATGQSQHMATGMWKEERTCNPELCPVDCVHTWFPWTSCSVSCGGGVQTSEMQCSTADCMGSDGHHDGVITQGKHCPSSPRERVCNTNDCPTPSPTKLPTAFPTAMPTKNPTPRPTRHPTANPTNSPTFAAVDCVVTGWTAFTACTYSCGGGTKSRTRTVTTHSEHGGKPCPAQLAHQVNCNDHPCPVDCRMTYWSYWGECSKTCGVGERLRSRTIVTANAHGGEACGELEESQSCSDGPCPIHCDVSPFSAWTECSKSCGGGIQTRSRSIIQHAEHGGFTCPFLNEKKGCHPEPCPVDCVLSDYTHFDPATCSASCGSGSMTRTRHIMVRPRRGGVACGPLSDTAECNTHPCPVNCDVGYWTSWETCSTSCGEGEQTRSRSVVNGASYGGRDCPILEDTRACSLVECPVHCEVSPWGLYSECSRTCGQGVQSRSRSVYTYHRFGGTPCPQLDQSQSCNQGPCPVDCAVSVYAPWETCSKSCDVGSQMRHRTVTTPAAHNGQRCPPLHEQRSCNTQSCPVDCVLAQWTGWDPCSHTCGGGTQMRTRHTITYNSAGGVPCQPTSESRGCGSLPCPVDCQMSAFSMWTTCSKSCGSGTMTRDRSITREMNHGGKACPSTTQTQECETQACPQDCVTSEWAAWSQCSKTCGAGMQDRQRSVVTDVAAGGVPCPELAQRQDCDEGPCPVHCDVTLWGDWSPCSKSCSTGFQTRSRTVTQHAQHGGYVCPGLEETRKCNTDHCPVDCVVTPFSAYGECSVSCGGGTQQRTRTATTEAAHGGSACPHLTESRHCSAHSCPVNCIVAPWEPWAQCSHSCGTGHHWRMRSVQVQVAFGGNACPELSQQGPCNVHECPKDCELSSWGDFGACTVTCGSGSQTRARTITVPQAAGGKCHTLSDTRQCSPEACPIDCAVSEWSSYTDCTKTCGTGSMTKTRSIIQQHLYGGKGCPITTVVQNCNTDGCPVDCVTSGWGQWSNCDKTCGNGQKFQTRVVHTAAAFGGVECPALKQEASCTDGACPVHCEVSAWAPPSGMAASAASSLGWSECSKTCGTGQQMRVRTITQHALHGGYVCPSLEETQTCNVHGCPVDCVVSEDAEWSDCSATCGGGVQWTPREILVQPQNGGVPCEQLREQRECGTITCPIDCVVSDWSDWTACSKSCGSGTYTRMRSENRAAAYGGALCPHTVETGECNADACPVDCVWNWHGWGGCQTPQGCGAGTQTRTKEITRTAAHGGVTCGALSETRSCDAGICPVHCAVSAFNSWGECDATCGFGSQTRTRSIVTLAAHGGDACPPLSETMVCSGGPCPVHCDVTNWASWSVCTKSCGGGSQSRSRTIVTHSLHGGYVCPDLHATRTCEAQACPNDCVMNEFSAWSQCTATCGTGTQSRRRTVNTQPARGGVPCPHFSETQDCNSDACPVDCVVSAWDGWTACTLTCGSGVQYNHRSRQVEPANGGKACPDLSTSRPCNTDGCPVDCFVSAWAQWGECTHSCGVGTQSRERTVETQAKLGGQACPALTLSQLCPGLQSCPVDCVVSEWADFNDCSVTCGVGSQTRTRMVGLHVAFGGKECPDLVEIRNCNDGPCPEHCVVTDFGTWGRCSKSCGGGVEVRTRSVTSHAAHGGYTCPSLEESRPCNDHSCPVDCVVGEWGAWGECSVSCAGGYQTRIRTATGGSFGGVECPSTSETQACATAACPVDCEQSDWTVWSECSESCGGAGTESRTRSVHVAAANGGQACGASEESQSCNEGPCPVHCETTEWSDWVGSFGVGACSKSCGTGSQTRSRAITQHAQNGGYVCPSLEEVRDCNTRPCPTDCTVSFYSVWSECSVSCGAGSKTRTRTVTQPALNGGVECPGLVETQACSDGPCPIHCSVSNFTGWGDCTRTCGGGSRSRTRYITEHSAHGGYVCPSLIEAEDCNPQPCPVDCVMTSYSDWSTCTVTCGGGTEKRTRSVETPAVHGGMACGVKEESRTCRTSLCPIDCSMGDWSDYGMCTKTCGTGTQARTRSISVQPNYGGVPCGVTSETQNCAQTPCPVDCVMSDYGSYTACSKSCGTGAQTRHRSIEVHNAYGGVACLARSDTRMCNTQACPINCMVDDFTEWSECSTSCGQGTQKRERAIVTDHSFGGIACPSLEERQACTDGPCPIHCEVSKFTEWSTCTKTCGAGTQHRDREVLTSAKHGGYTCPFLRETRFCSESPCPVDCLVSDYNTWSTCTKTCGYGEQQRSRTVTTPAEHGGVACPSLVETQECNTDECPIDCVMTGWDHPEFDSCSKSCGSGSQTRHRSITTPAGFGGVACTATHETRECNSEPCPVDCILNDWGSFGDCSLSCNTGSRTRTRTVHRSPAFGGVLCGPLAESEACATTSCPIDCVLSEWSQWSTCTATCGTGQQQKHRSVDVGAAFGGVSCANLAETRDCNTDACPVDCAVGRWNAWSECSRTCGPGGETHRSRAVVTPPAHGGEACPDLTQSQSCNEGPCPVHCTVGEWMIPRDSPDEWSRCTKTCGGGQQTRHREILTHAQHGGYTCPLLTEVRDCNKDSCPVDCRVGRWGAWSECSHTCGTGERTRSRVLTDARFGGRACPHSQESATCNTETCPIDCVLSQWEPWEQCSKSCGGGTQERRREIQRSAAYGGAACEHLDESRECNNYRCPVNCEVGEWTDYGECSHTCGTGSKTRTRPILVAPQNGGDSCIATSDTAECNAHHCAFDCQVSAWADWSQCSKSCGPGFRSRKRTVTDNHLHGGVGCPHLIETDNCEHNTCPVDCKLSEWTRWSYCTTTCGGGSQTKTRTRIVAPQSGGGTCGALTETRECQTQTCPVDCVMSNYTEWSSCSKTCGTGTKIRTRTVVSAASDGGHTCGATTESADCNGHHCAVDCDISEFSAWTACTVTCGGGQQERQRHILTHHQHGGSECPHLHERQQCNTEFCPIDCKVGDWEAWGACSKSCGGGQKIHQRALIHLSAHGGASCPVLEESKQCAIEPCPVDCVAAEWNVWSECTKTCGGGSQSRTREVSSPVHGGQECPHTKETQECNVQACPVNCTVTHWDEWTDCSQTCGTGSRTRARSVAVPMAHGGQECPHLTESQECADGPCPLHCQVTAFGTWSSCTVTCGSGTATRSRSVVSKAAHGGYTCPNLDETRSCNTDACPLDCVVGDWGEWSACTKTCGTGQSSRKRDITSAVQNGGAECPHTEEKKDCNTYLCPVDCKVSRWSMWSDCSQTCGAGSETRQRSVVEPMVAGGISCPALSESKACNDGPCPVHCKVSDFGAWTRCTKTCGLGTMRRSRTIISHAAHNGFVCPHLSEKKDCELRKCPIDCLMREWSEWGKCDRSCGGGSQSTTRVVRRPATNGGRPCGATVRTVSCNTRRCPIDCEVTAWLNWKSCTKSCGSGTQKRYRNVKVHAAYMGVACPSLIDERSCNAQECPIDCVLSEFSEWGTCTKSCNAGSQTRSREIVTSPIFGGKTCMSLTETQGCNAHACPVACVVSAYGAWTSCSKTCGTGETVRSRSIRVDAANGGKKCPELVERTKCNAQPCPTDCSVTEWSAFDSCDASCGTGVATRVRSIDVDAAYGGKACPPLSQTQECNAHSCPVDCKTSEWLQWNGTHQWSSCTSSCGAGFQERTREVVSEAKFGGGSCGELQETQACNNGPCPVHCDVGPFSEWTDCTATCGSGSQTRSREIVSKAVHGGYTCPFLTESILCNTAPCPVDCVVTDFAEWDTVQCDKTCGTGYKKRERKVTTPMQHGGKACPHPHETQECNTAACPEDCMMSEWGDWTTCTKSCGGGSQTRTRSIDREDAYGGKECEALSKTRECNSFSCPVDCAVTEWESWSICSSSCGGGIQSRSRKVSSEYMYGGKSCPHLAESQACNEDVACPVDCAVSAFGPWTSCSKSCADGEGAGTQNRQREVTTSPLYGGKQCPDLDESRQCNTKECPVDCQLGAWGDWSGCAVKCGGGLKQRSRPVIRPAAHGGAQCAHKEEKKQCNSQGCTCQHVYCVVQPGSRHIKVMHHKLEWAKGGRKHRCKFNYDTQNCECMCYNDIHWSKVTQYDTRPCQQDAPNGNDVLRLHAEDADPTKANGEFGKGISESGRTLPCSSAEDAGRRLFA